MQEKKINVFLLITGQMVSVLGSGIYLVAVILFIKELTQSPSALGIFQFFAYLPIVLLAPAGGLLADSAHKKRIIILADLFRGIIMILLGVLLYAGALTYPLLLAGTFFVSVFTAIFHPSVHALFPELSPPGSLRKINSLKSAFLFSANLAGTSIGGFAYSFFGPALVFIFNGITFAASAAEECFIKYNPDQLINKSFVPSDIKGKFIETVSYFRSEKGVSTVLLTYSLINSLYPPIILSLPFLLEQKYMSGNVSFGLSLALLLCGGGLGSVWYGFSRTRERFNSMLFYGSLVLLSAVLVIISFINSSSALMAILPAAGFSIGVVHQIITTSLYRLVSPGIRGRVFGMMESMASLTVPVSYIISGFLIQLMKNRLSLFYFMMGLLLASSVLLIRLFTPLGSFLSKEQIYET